MRNELPPNESDRFEPSTLAPVTVIVPCYNCSSTIRRAIASVAAQTLRPSEVILINDGSTDTTSLAIHDLVACYPPGWIRIAELEKNEGPSVARNFGWSIATQPYIAFLDSDDEWHPEKIAIQYAWMRDRPDVVLTGRNAILLRQQTDEYVQRETPEASQIRPLQLLLKNRFSTPTVMLKRDIDPRFVPSKRRSEDYLLWLTIVLNGYPSWRLDLPPTTYHQTSAGLSANLWKMELGELNTFVWLYSEGYLSLANLLWLLPFSMLKFVRRALAAALRRR